MLLSPVPAREFRLLTRWTLPAPPAVVWSTLRQTVDWPLWWRDVKAVEELEPGGPDGVGAVQRFHWGSRLPYDLRLTVRTTVCEAPTRLCGHASGDLRGRGEWTLAPRPDGGTDVHYRWCVLVEKRWMRWLAPLLRPLFAWNHRAVMAAGEAGLRRWLARGDR